MSATGSTPARAHAVLVLVRHGESVWNRSMRLTGWADVALSGRGREQSRRAGTVLRGHGIAPDVCYSSRLRRAVETRDLLLESLGRSPPCHQSWRINERHYGALQGLRWWQAVWRFGVSAVVGCRREFEQPPPLLAAPAASPAAAEVDPADESEWCNAQRGESLADALRRFLPLWDGEIAPALRSGACVIIVAHNNVLRGLIRHLEGGRGRPGASLATGQPWIFELDADLRILSARGL